MTKKYLFFILCSLFAGNAYAQQTDSLFNKAKSLAAEAQYQEAISLIQQLHESNPENADYTIYLARVYFWAKDLPRASSVIKTICKEGNCTQKEALDLLLQIESAQGNSEAAITLAQKGMDVYPEHKHHYALHKARALEQAGKDADALAILQDIPKQAPNQRDVAYLATSILKKQKNMVSTGYLQTSFEESLFASLHFAHLEYGRQFKKHTQQFRLNYAYAFGKSTFQLESDAYIKGRKRDYIYINAGISDKQSIFPFLKAGAEYYKEFKHVSSSLGGRYLFFDASNSTVLLTGHIAYSLKSWTLNYRPFALLLKDNTLASHVFYLRKSFEHRESYIQLDLQYGSLPYFFYTTDLLSRLNAYRAGLSSKIRIAQNYFVQPAFMYEREEYVPDHYRNRYTGQIILSKRF